MSIPHLLPSEQGVACETGDLSVEVSPAVVDLLGRENPVSEKQEALNLVFGTERREKMIDEASLDSKGQPVIYYRKFRQNQAQQLAHLLSVGSLEARDFFPPTRLMKISIPWLT